MFMGRGGRVLENVHGTTQRAPTMRPMRILARLIVGALLAVCARFWAVDSVHSCRAVFVLLHAIWLHGLAPRQPLLTRCARQRTLALIACVFFKDKVENR